MTPAEAKELKDMEARLDACEEEVSVLLRDETSTADELKQAIFLERLTRATCYAMRMFRGPNGAPCVEDFGPNVIAFPGNRLTH